MEISLREYDQNDETVQEVKYNSFDEAKSQTSQAVRAEIIVSYHDEKTYKACKAIPLSDAKKINKL